MLLSQMIDCRNNYEIKFDITATLVRQLLCQERKVVSSQLRYDKIKHYWGLLEDCILFIVGK